MTKRLIMAACAMTLLSGCMHGKHKEAAEAEKPAAEAAATEQPAESVKPNDDGGQGGGERVGKVTDQ